MSAVARGISAQSLNARLPEGQMPPELAEMAHSFNAMLARLDDSFQRLSAFSADIAHELRTPLSNLLTHTQVTLTRPRALEDYREALHSNLEELQWMAQLVNDMLYLAKADDFSEIFASVPSFCISAMIFGSTSFRLTPSTPSTMINGWLLPVIEPIPRILMAPPSAPG